jgi:hypothetical protein
MPREEQSYFNKEFKTFSEAATLTVCIIREYQLGIMQVQTILDQEVPIQCVAQQLK